MSNRTNRSASNARALTALFGEPPVLAGENKRGYDDLLARVTKCVKPKDILEKIWVRDVVDLTWEIFRWRRFVTESTGDIERVEKYDRLAMMAEIRRNAALREIERHRSSFAQNLGQAIRKPKEVKLRMLEKHAA
jgi:hypothetical protein